MALGAQTLEIRCRAAEATAVIDAAVADRRIGSGELTLGTDNGSPYRSTVHALARRALGIRHLRTRPRRPQTNGKAERFIRTLQAGWAYGAIYGSSRERTAALDGWLGQRRNRLLASNFPDPCALDVASRG